MIVSQDASSIYTKTGDDGTTGRLFGGRIPKDDLLVEVCGDIDETVAALGLARARMPVESELRGTVLEIQRDLFVIAADLMANPRARHRLAAGVSRADPDMTARLEAHIDRLVAQRPLRPVFIVPGATEISAALDMARAVIRRAERHVVHAARGNPSVSTSVVTYLNRASDLLYVMARHAAADVDEAVSHQ